MTAANLIDPERSGPMIIWAFIEQRTKVWARARVRARIRVRARARVSLTLTLTLNLTKGFGFIEFRTLAEAESVYALNG